MLFIGRLSDESTDAHEGFVAGRSGDGALSDIWTDVVGSGPDAFDAYVAACECGWSGAPRPVDARGYRSAQRDWLHDHFLRLVPVAPRADRSEFLGFALP